MIVKQNVYQQIENRKRSATAQVCRQYSNHGIFIANPRNLLNKQCLVLECNLCTSFALFTSLNIDVLHLIIVIYLCFIFIGLILLIGAKIELKDDV